MTKDAMDQVLEDVLRDDAAGSEPTREFAEALLAETTRSLPRPRRRLLPLIALVTAGAAAAVLLFAVLTNLGGPAEDEGPPMVNVAAPAVPPERPIPAFRASPMGSRLYSDPVEYLRKHDVDVTVAGLVDFYQRLAKGEKPGFSSAKWAVLDALSRRAGSAFAPLLTHLWEVDADPSARRHVLLMMKRVRDRVLVPWLDARLADAPPGLLLDVAKTRVAHDRVDPAAAAVLRATAGSRGLLDPARPEYSAGQARDLLVSLQALGHPTVLEDYARVLVATPTPDLVHAAWAALGERPAPDTFRTALETVARRSLAAEDPGYDDIKVLDLLARAGDDRYVPLLQKLLADDYVPLAVDAARTAGAWKKEAAQAALLKAWRRAKRMGEDGEDLIPPALWAAGRCGDADAVKRLLAFLESTEWYRAGEWAVDALLSLDAPVGDILMALPDETWSVGRLPALLAHATRSDLASLTDRIADLPDGHLKSAFLLVRELGTGPGVRTYLRTVVDKGGHLGLYLRHTSADAVRATLGKKKAHDAVLALQAIAVLPISVEEKRKLAAIGLTASAPRVRAEAAGVLVRLGGVGAPLALRERLAVERSAYVRDRLALALLRLGSDAARPLLIGEVPEASPLAVTLDLESLYRTDRERLRTRLEGRTDPLAEGYRRLAAGEPRRGSRPSKGNLFVFEPAR